MPMPMPMPMPTPITHHPPPSPPSPHPLASPSLSFSPSPLLPTQLCTRPCTTHACTLPKRPRPSTRPPSVRASPPLPSLQPNAIASSLGERGTRDLFLFCSAHLIAPSRSPRLRPGLCAQSARLAARVEQHCPAATRPRKRVGCGNRSDLRASPSPSTPREGGHVPERHLAFPLRGPACLSSPALCCPVLSCPLPHPSSRRRRRQPPRAYRPTAKPSSREQIPTARKIKRKKRDFGPETVREVGTYLGAGDRGTDM
ncbi:hypothetical protein BS50DRAFT_139762 [Corynespora cassiicola Philippines]|uniref:Uncharacterized protein n=1 Tax=Corynespora cassiicola Philippines TaxID=1448308 RepID=A0A2T2N9R4_CORCC|nr:hypothetical protein BS50DRAFT_139762 [Corynespora cassiicola Philippines]